MRLDREQAARVRAISEEREGTQLQVVRRLVGAPLMILTGSEAPSSRSNPVPIVTTVTMTRIIAHADPAATLLTRPVADAGGVLA